MTRIRRVVRIEKKLAHTNWQIFGKE